MRFGLLTTQQGKAHTTEIAVYLVGSAHVSDPHIPMLTPNTQAHSQKTKFNKHTLSA